MPAIEARNLMEAYPKLLEYVLQGRRSHPRGQSVIEGVRPITWTLQRPSEWGLFIPGRRINPFFALAEVVWMWSGKGGVEFIAYYNSSMKNFADGNIPYFNAAYGRRVRHYGYSELPFRDTPSPMSHGQLPEPVEVDQLDWVVSKLQADPETRQAAVTLWDPIKDNFHTSKDYPCNNMLYFSQREGKLNLTVVIRSNDLVWGVPYNMIQFVHLQALIAGTLDYEIGEFTVMCNNLHVYESLYPETFETVKRFDASRYAVSDLYNDTLDMRWTLSAFGNFVANHWDPIEKELRGMQDSHTLTKQPRAHGAQMTVINHRLFRLFETLGVPAYWQQVFTVMFAHHCRKAHTDHLYQECLDTLGLAQYWLIQDFTLNKKV